MNEEIDDSIYRHCLWLINTKGFYKDDAGKERDIMAKRFAEYIQRLVVEARIDEQEYHLKKLVSGDWISYATEVDNRLKELKALSTDGGQGK